MTSAGHRLRIRNAIAKLAPTSDIQANSNSAVATPDVAAASGERRQLTVMFCDLVGSTALSEKLDPEELRSLLHAYRTLCGDVIARYDGFVARYVGDGILTYFGWPTAHEEDAERAVRAALEIVQTVKRASSTEDLAVRIGIATGPVVVGEQAGTGDQSKLAVGSTPNLAARLQALAAADQIVIAASTRRLAGNAFELTDLGEHELKGIAEPVHAWRVERALVTESRFDANRGGSALRPRGHHSGYAAELLMARLEHEGFFDKYTRAREMQGHTHAGMAIEKAVTAKDAGLGRLAYDALRWHASKLVPKVYGDKTEVAVVGANGGPVQNVTVSTADPIEAARVMVTAIRHSDPRMVAIKAELLHGIPELTGIQINKAAFLAVAAI